MDILALLEALRTDYLQEFEAAYYQQIEVNEQVFPEIALEISGGLYKRLFVVDLIGRNGEANSAIEVGISKAVYGGEVSFHYRDLTIEFGRVSWDSMRFVIQPAHEELVGFEQWFDKWIDLDGTRHVDDQILSNVIHSSRLENGLVEVDFGSAPTNSAVELFDLFNMNEVKTVLVSSGRE
ncbi:MAG: hypothetical protein ACRBBQ_13745 [Cognatishimia sp.]